MQLLYTIITVEKKTPPQVFCYKHLKKLKSVCTKLLEGNTSEGISSYGL
jgi:hypothetical protein